MRVNTIFFTWTSNLMRRQSPRPISILQSARVAALILIALAGTVGSAQASQPGLHVEILGIRNSIGAVACALFEGPGGFPTEFLRFATNIMMVQVRATKATCDFADRTCRHPVVDAHCSIVPGPLSTVASILGSPLIGSAIVRSNSGQGSYEILLPYHSG